MVQQPKAESFSISTLNSRNRVRSSTQKAFKRTYGYVCRYPYALPVMPDFIIIKNVGFQVAVAETKGRRELQEARSLAAAMEDRASVLQEQARVGVGTG